MTELEFSYSIDELSYITRGLFNSIGELSKTIGELKLIWSALLLNYNTKSMERQIDINSIN